MNKKEFEVLRRELEVTDANYRSILLKELKEHEEWRLGPNYQADMEEKFNSWEQEAQTLITKEIKDPYILAAIWKHHGRNEFLETDDLKESHDLEGVKTEEDTYMIEKKDNKIISLLILLLIFGFLAFIVVGIFLNL